MVQWRMMLWASNIGTACTVERLFFPLVTSPTDWVPDLFLWLDNLQSCRKVKHLGWLLSFMVRTVRVASWRNTSAQTGGYLGTQVIGPPSWIHKL